MERIGGLRGGWERWERRGEWGSEGRWGCGGALGMLLNEGDIENTVGTGGALGAMGSVRG